MAENQPTENMDNDNTSAPEPLAEVLQACTVCQASLDVAELEPLEVVACPSCGAEVKVAGQIANFELVSVAGKGGMGIVYRAFDPGLDRTIAIKLLRRDRSSDATIVQQMANEAAVTASINHPHVVRVFGTGMENGRFYIAMELVDKGSLDDLIQLQGRVAEAQILNVGIQIAEGLKAAQAVGLIHRDVKPGNILFVDANTSKIVDFGLAIFQANEEDYRGEIWGTPYYVAPEKLDNKPEDFRSDMYSLGATLFHALAGRPPFEAENASYVALKHLKNQPVSIQSFAPWVSDATAYVINKTLNKNPDDRFASYDDMVENLRFAKAELDKAGGRAPARKRVVVDGDVQQQSAGNLVIIMIAAVLLLLGGGAFFFLKGTKPDETADPTKPTKGTAAPAVIADKPWAKSVAEKDFDRALEFLAAASFDEARDSIQGALKKPGLTASQKSWGLLIEATTEFASGRLPEARALTRLLAEPASKSPAELKAFLEQANTVLTADKAYTQADADKFDPTDITLFGHLLAGFQASQFGDINTSGEILRKFRNIQPTPKNAWVLTLKPLVTTRLEEIASFEMLVGQLKAASTGPARAAIAGQMKQMGASFAAVTETATRAYAAAIEAAQVSLSKPPQPGTFVRIINRKNSAAVDIMSNRTNHGDPVSIYNEHGNENQVWRVLDASGAFQFESSAHRFLGVADEIPADGRELRIFNKSNSNSNRQTWRVESADVGWFRIVNLKNSKALTVSGNPTEGKLFTAPANNGHEQQWRFVVCGNAIKDGWEYTDLGIGIQPSTVELDPAKGTASLVSYGADLHNRADNGTFVYKQINTDIIISAKVTSIENSNEWAKAGVMVRDGLGVNSINFAMLLSAKMPGLVNCRHWLSHDTVNSKIPEIKPPYWLKIERRGDKVVGYSSPDGKNWTKRAEKNIVLGKHILVGLASCSHNPAKASKSTFEDIVMTPIKP